MSCSLVSYPIQQRILDAYTSEEQEKQKGVPTIHLTPKDVGITYSKMQQQSILSLQKTSMQMTAHIHAAREGIVPSRLKPLNIDSPIRIL